MGWNKKREQIGKSERACQAKQPSTCLYHGIPNQKRLLIERISQTTDKRDSYNLMIQMKELESYEESQYTQHPAHPEGGTIEGPHGVKLPQLQGEWKWDFSTERIILKNKNFLTSEFVSIKSKEAFLEDAPVKAKEILDKITTLQNRAIVQEYYERKYSKESLEAIPPPPVEGLVDLAKTLPQLPEGQHWQVRTIPYLEFAIMKDHQILGKHGPFEDTGRSPMPEDASPSYIDAAVKDTVKRAEKKIKEIEEAFII